MKKKVLFFACLFGGLSVSALQAQITSGAGGMIGANSPSTNTRVGIGYNNPQASLDVKSEIRATSAGGSNYLSLSSPGAYHVIRSTNNLTMQMDNSGSLSFVLGGSTRMGLYSSGRVGIGTTSPAEMLHVSGNTVVNGYSLIGSTTVPNTSAKLQVHNGSIMVSGANSFGGPMVTFSDNTATSAYPNGRYAIEYVPNTGLNFCQLWNPNYSGSNYNMLIRDDRKVGIGIDPTYTTGSMPNSFAGSYLLYVKDGIMTEKVKIALYGTANWADYVFADDYKLMPLEEVEAFVKANDHLPNVPSAQDLVDKGGIEVEKMMAKQMEKIEELTLYIIEQNKRIQALEAQMVNNK